jgi:hypothetical protein
VPRESVKNELELTGSHSLDSSAFLLAVCCSLLVARCLRQRGHLFLILPTGLPIESKMKSLLSFLFLVLSLCGESLAQYYTSAYGSSSSSNYGNSNSGQGGYSDYNGGYSSSSSSSSSATESIALNVCQDSVVMVTSVYITCTSPYTFYYGNGAHHNDVVCDYLDKASVKVSFSVIADIEEESDIYMTMALLDEAGHVLTVTDPSFLCNNYVGNDCTAAGHYSFSKKFLLDTPKDSSADESNFTPQIQMAFSTKANHGYNLGALNTECREWDASQPALVSWSTHARPTGMLLLVQKYGALTGTCMAMVCIIAFVWRQASRNSALFLLEESVYGKDNTGDVPLVA